MLAKVRSSRSAPRLGLALVALILTIAAGGCRCARGPVNASPALRWWLFSNFGASRICPEMVKRGVGLRMPNGGAVVGRFFPNQCATEVDDQNQVVTVKFAGTGYGYTTMTRRVGFRCTAAVQYRPDFYLGEDDIYVWGKFNRIVAGPTFELGYLENPAANVATTMTPFGPVANTFGNQIVTGELTRGFTVLQTWDTESKSFALGILMPPQKPMSPFDVSKDEHYTYGNETVEIAGNQRDYLGPFEVVEGTQTLQLKLFLQGPPIDVLLVRKLDGDTWRDAYQRGVPLGQPPLVAGRPLYPGTSVDIPYKVPPGSYYVVLDNTATAGGVNPPQSMLDPLNTSSLARVSYVAQLIDR